jgi:hypothetical protein
VCCNPIACVLRKKQRHIELETNALPSVDNTVTYECGCRLGNKAANTQTILVFNDESKQLYIRSTFVLSLTFSPHRCSEVSTTCFQNCIEFITLFREWNSQHKNRLYDDPIHVLLCNFL